MLYLNHRGDNSPENEKEMLKMDSNPVVLKLFACCSGSDKDSFESINDVYLIHKDGTWECHCIEYFENWYGDRGRGISGHITNIDNRTSAIFPEVKEYHYGDEPIYLTPVERLALARALRNKLPDSVSVPAYGGCNTYGLNLYTNLIWCDNKFTTYYNDSPSPRFAYSGEVI